MLKENGVVKIELDKDRIKTIGANTPAYSQGFKYPNGVKITNKTVEGLAQQHGEITFETLDGNKYLVLLSSGDYDSLFCTMTTAANRVSTSYVTWDFDSLEISGTKDTTIAIEQKTVKDKDGNILKSEVDPTKDSVEILKTKKITLPLLIDNLNADALKLEGKDFVLVETVKSKVTTTADSIISDTLKTDNNVTYPVLRNKVYKYYAIVRYPHEVWKSDIQHFTGLNQSNTVRYFGGVNVEEITYKMEEGKKWDKKSHKINKVSVTFDSHGVTK